MIEIDKWVAAACGQDLTRPSLIGVWFQGGRQVASDGHRLHVKPAPDSPQGPIAVKIDGEVFTGDLLKTYGHVPFPDPDLVTPQETVTALDAAVWLNARDLKRVFQEADDFYRSHKVRSYRGAIVDLEPQTNTLIVSCIQPGAVIKVNGLVPPAKKRTFEADQVGVKIIGLDAPGMKPFRPSRSKLDYMPKQVARFETRYLLDAIGVVNKTTRVRWFQQDSMSPLKLTHDDGRYAVIMPKAVR